MNAIAPLPKKRLRFVLAHDWTVAARGGERVLDSIARALSSRGHEVVCLLTMADNGARLGPSIDGVRRSVAPVGRLPGACGPLRRWMFPLYPIAVGQLSRLLASLHAQTPVDALVSTSSAAVKGIAAPRGVPHVCYCHSPARYAWAQQSEYARGSLLRRMGLALYAPTFRAWDRATARNVSLFIANSTHIAARIADAFGRESRVLHPPVRTDLFTPDPSVPRGDHVFVVSALEPYKRVDAAIDAARRAGRRIVIAGTGSEEDRLRSLADNDRVKLLGRIDDARLVSELRCAHAVLYPQVEDFGITALEAQACGTPVVALSAGGALDTVDDPTTGLLVPDHDAMAGAINRVAHRPLECRANALRFGEASFERRLIALLRSVIDA